MKKASSSFVCQECGYNSPQYLGKCPECGSWNTLKEFKIAGSKKQATGSHKDTSELKPRTLSEIKSTTNQRISTGFSEMDRVLGGGIVSGSLILLAGDPGVGKSTLLLQAVMKISETTKGSVLYISGEESEEQIKIRAERLSKKENKNLFLLATSQTDSVVEIIEKEKPSLVIIDSIQTMESEAVAGLSGSVGQIRYATSVFLKAAKSLSIPLIIVGHVTKEGMVAGPMMLSHMVDTVLFLEGEKVTQTRILRSLKNRFGPVDEVGVFLMDGEGLKEANNPEQLFLNLSSKKVSGSVLTVTMEGTRPFLVEIQALTVFSKLPIPRRVATGIDSRRLELLLAVLTKHCKIPLDGVDVFVNVAGGLKITDPGADLAICLALFSSYKNIALSKTVGVAEVGLLGELRNVPSAEKRIAEAKKLGFKDVVTAKDYSFLFQVIRSLQ